MKHKIRFRILTLDILIPLKDVPLELYTSLPKFKNPAKAGTGKKRLVFAPAKHVNELAMLDFRIDFHPFPYEI